MSFISRVKSGLNGSDGHPTSILCQYTSNGFRHFLPPLFNITHIHLYTQRQKRERLLNKIFLLYKVLKRFSGVDIDDNLFSWNSTRGKLWLFWQVFKTTYCTGNNTYLFPVLLYTFTHKQTQKAKKTCKLGVILVFFLHFKYEFEKSWVIRENCSMKRHSNLELSLGKREKMC